MKYEPWFDQTCLICIGQWCQKGRIRHSHTACVTITFPRQILLQVISTCVSCVFHRVTRAFFDSFPFVFPYGIPMMLSSSLKCVPSLISSCVFICYFQCFSTFLVTRINFFFVSSIPTLYSAYFFHQTVQLQMLLLSVIQVVKFVDDYNSIAFFRFI